MLFSKNVCLVLSSITTFPFTYQDLASITIHWTTSAVRYLGTMKDQSSSEVLVITSGLISIVTSSLLIVFLVSLLVPDQFQGVPLAGNLQFLETEIETQLDLYSISSPVPVNTISYITQLVLISLCSVFIIESLYLIAGVKSKVSYFILTNTYLSYNFIFQKKLYLLPWSFHLSVEFLLFTGLMITICISLFKVAIIPGK